MHKKPLRKINPYYFKTQYSQYNIATVNIASQQPSLPSQSTDLRAAIELHSPHLLIHQYYLSIVISPIPTALCPQRAQSLTHKNSSTTSLICIIIREIGTRGETLQP